MTALTTATDPTLYPRREPMFKTLHDALCCILGCGLFPTLFLAVAYSAWWAIGWALAVLVLVIWESIGLPKGEFRA